MKIVDQQCLDEQCDTLARHREHLYYLWSGRVSLFSILLLAYIAVIVALLISQQFITSINTFGILQDWLLSAFLFVFAAIVGISALVLWKEYRESNFKMLSFTFNAANPPEVDEPRFFNIVEFLHVIRSALSNLRQKNKRRHFWRPELSGPHLVDPESAYNWKIYTYFEVVGYLGAGFLSLALGYLFGLLAVVALALCTFTLGFFILVSALTRFDVSWYIYPVDLSRRPGLGNAIVRGTLLLPQWARVGTCNVYMRLYPRDPKPEGTPLEVSLEAAGVTVEGNKSRDQPSKLIWDEVWNCALPATGDYTLNLKISTKTKKPKTITTLATITHSTKVSGFFGQTLTPFVLAVLPVIITAIVTLATTKELRLPGF